MYISPTLTKDEFRDIHNALCDLDMVAQDLEEVLKPEKFLRLLKAKSAIREALKRSYEEEREVFSTRSDLYDSARSELGCRSVWSIYEVEDLYAEHPYQGATEVAYKDHWGEKSVRVPLAGSRWLDLYIAADYLIKESGDDHHIYIEQFKPLQENNTVLMLQTGS